MRINIYQNKLVKMYKLDNNKIVVNLISNKINNKELEDYQNVLLRIFDNINATRLLGVSLLSE